MYKTNDVTSKEKLSAKLIQMKTSIPKKNVPKRNQTRGEYKSRLTKRIPFVSTWHYFVQT